MGDSWLQTSPALWGLGWGEGRVGTARAQEWSSEGFLEEGMWEFGFEKCIGVHKAKQTDRAFDLGRGAAHAKHGNMKGAVVSTK